MVHENDSPAIVIDNTTIAAQTSHGVVPIVPSHNFTKYFHDVSTVEEAKEIRKSLLAKYTAEDATKQKFVIGHHAVQCRNRAGKNDNPAKPRVNLVEADDIIVAIISQANLVANLSDWVIDSGATRHICANKTDFMSYTQVNEGEEVVYLGDSSTTQVLGKGKVLFKLTFEKTLALTEVLHVPSIRTNLVSVGLLGKVG
ncbi:uncharacterized protein [Solanum tuberosum]|uniref:uncharacterized protein n=1 Tax=Solanum tuberosum TaxID=4113 RepID=UPI00073A0332|nr:PREDICTED: uncharacterized protein LOC107058784 [Solanum tuberosum]